jgi:hypothetical protein
MPGTPGIRRRQRCFLRKLPVFRKDLAKKRGNTGRRRGMARAARGFIPEKQTQVKEAVDISPPTGL